MDGIASNTLNVSSAVDPRTLEEKKEECCKGFELKSPDGKVVATINAANPNSNGCDEGVWVELKADDKTKPTICLVKDKPNGMFMGGWYLGVYRDAAANPVACDLAVRFDKDEGPVLQVVKNGQIETVSLFALAQHINGH